MKFFLSHQSVVFRAQFDLFKNKDLKPSLVRRVSCVKMAVASKWRRSCKLWSPTIN